MEYEKIKIYGDETAKGEPKDFLLKSLDRQIFEMPAVCH